MRGTEVETHVRGRNTLECCGRKEPGSFRELKVNILQHRKERGVWYKIRPKKQVGLSQVRSPV